MPDSTGSHREFQHSTIQPLAEMEAATGKPVLILEEPELNVAATIRRARAGQASHVLRSRSGGDPILDWLSAFKCRMVLQEVPDQKAVKEAPETAEG